ncbi:ABC transporter permease [Actinomadura rayongensis]|uniref:FtsX-like permease family protein n=1 Tax=Actinomadura rayongensis TaxID=1429076 RepID=A0A6I4WF53_9ACTN|nr:ABC transporter permease [Actinomadura rayongensis]MXQ65554.1 FtsX-like permease family protein [Actinomadura rayongensis]
MFFLTYLRRELRQRTRQAVFIALGLAVGVGLVITVTAASAGVRQAQAKVLHSLYGIGTDVTVAAPAPKRPPKKGTGGLSFKPGAATRYEDILQPPTDLGEMDAATVARIARLHGVAAAAGGLSLVDQQFTVPSRDQLKGRPLPPSALIPNTFAINGVDVAHTGLGPYGSGTLTAGRSLAASDAAANVAVVDATYAANHRLQVGSTVYAGGMAFKVVGIVRQQQGGDDVYVPLARAQAMSVNTPSDLRGKVNQIYVAAAGASSVPALRDAISALLPDSTVTTSGSLASAVSGSLANASRLADDLGRWTAVAALLAAFGVAALLTMAAVTRRTAEFGTLRALGWSGRRVIAQIMGESFVTGVLGAVAGVALGFGGAGLIRLFAPSLSATVAQNPGSAQGPGLDDPARTVDLHLTAPVTLSVVLVSVALALAGGLLAGSLGGWLATRLRPAEALRRVR